MASSQGLESLQSHQTNCACRRARADGVPHPADITDVLHPSPSILIDLDVNSVPLQAVTAHA